LVNPGLLIAKLQMYGCSSLTLLWFKIDHWSKFNRQLSNGVRAEIVTDDEYYSTPTQPLLIASVAGSGLNFLRFRIQQHLPVSPTIMCVLSGK